MIAAWLGRLAPWLLGPRARLVAAVVAVLGVSAVLGLAEWRRTAAERDLARAKAELAELRAERDRLADTIQRQRVERDRARRTAEVLERRQGDIRRQVDDLRARLAATAEGRSRCEAALEEIRRYGGRLPSR